MSNNGLVKFEELFIEFFSQVVQNPKLLATNKLRAKFILQRLYFLQRPDELQAALKILQRLNLVSSIIHPNISGVIEEVETNLAQIINQASRKLVTKISDITFKVVTNKPHSAGKNSQAARDLL